MMSMKSLKYVLIFIIISWFFIWFLSVNTNFRSVNVLTDYYFNNNFRIKSKQEYFNYHDKVVNNFSYRYTINNVSVCDRSTILYIVVVHSSIENYQRRERLRESWAQPNFFRNYPSALIFFIGIGNSSIYQQNIEQESRIYGDIIQLDFIENYKNLTIKAINVYKWINSFCQSAKYVVKTDDDIFINPFYMLQLMIKNLNRKRTIICHIYSRSPIIRKGEESCKDHLKKWCISKDYLPKIEVYPSYCSGSAFIYTTDLSEEIYNTAKHVTYFYIDDVYVTGLVLRSIKNFTKYNILTENRHLADINDFARALKNQERDLFATHIFYSFNQDLRTVWISLLKSMVSKDFDIVNDNVRKLAFEILKS